MTKTITYEGVEYRKVTRKAEEGELVYVSGHALEEANGVKTVDTVCHGGADDGHIDYGKYGRRASGYYVLEPIESEEVPVEASPTVIELLANISRRLYEAEQTIKSQAYEINELYRSLAEQAVADRG